MLSIVNPRGALRTHIASFLGSARLEASAPQPDSVRVAGPSDPRAFCGDGKR